MREQISNQWYIHTHPTPSQRHLYWEYTWYQSFMKELRKYLHQLDCHIVYWGYNEEGFNDPETLKIFGNIYNGVVYGEIIIHFQYHHHIYALEFQSTFENTPNILLYSIDHLLNNSTKLLNFSFVAKYHQQFEELIRELKFYFHLPSIILLPYILPKLDDLLSSIFCDRQYPILF